MLQDDLAAREEQVTGLRLAVAERDAAIAELTQALDRQLQVIYNS